MACPTCSHTMQTFGSIGNFWCPRCGTIKRDHPGCDTTEAPKLVERCREFRDKAENGMGLSSASAHLWHRLGIAESINTPEKRP